MDNVTRWNSTYAMLHRNVDAMVAIREELKYDKRDDLLLSSEEIAVSESIVDLLSAFKEVSSNKFPI